MTNTDHQSECVILLHGLARTRLSMRHLEKALQARDYCVVNINYPSRKLSIDELAEVVIDECIKAGREQHVETFNFVTHSLGGILVRQYTQHHDIPGLKRVVMLAPPNQGSEAVDKLKNIPGFKWFHGPAGSQLGTSENDIPKNLGAVDFDLGVIAGKRSINFFLSKLIPGQDDGKVSVESTKAEGMKDFITLPCTHTFMMRNPEIIRQTIHFLENGKFDHSTKPEPLRNRIGNG